MDEELKHYKGACKQQCLLKKLLSVLAWKSLKDKSLC